MLKKIKILDYERRQEPIKIIKNIIIGELFSIFIFAMTFIFYLDFSYMGAHNKEMESLVFQHFKIDLVWINAKILLVYLFIGILIGFFSWLLKLRKKRFVLLFHIFIWFMFWIHAIKYYPQMFINQLFQKGGIFKLFQILITDFIPFALIYIIFIGFIVLISIVNRRILAPIVIFSTCLLLIVKINVSAFGGKPIENVQLKPPNVLIIATDSLRPQNISYNGYSRETPFIDSLFRKGANFLNIKSSMARTLPSWTSIFTSMFPPHHGIRHMFPSIEGLKKNWKTLVDVFNENNYYTAVVSDFAGDRFPSVDYGFQEVIAPELTIQNILKQRCQEFHYFLLGFILNPSARIIFPELTGMSLLKDPWYLNQSTKRSIKKAVKQKKPFFILYFSSNNHFPYVTKYPYYQKYIPRDYKGRHKYSLSYQVIASFLEEVPKKDEIKYIVDHYDSAMSLFDDCLGDLLTYLKKCNLRDNTIIIVMSDHGENLYEANYGVAHGDHLLGSGANNMVFGIYSPFETFNGRKIKQTVRDIDIAPTILNLLNMEIPESFKGKSLLPVLRGADFSGYPAYMETGIWYSPKTPYLENKVRCPYPNILNMLKVELPSGNLCIDEKYEHIVNIARYKAIQLNERKYIYMPGESSYSEEYYINDVPVKFDDIQKKPDILSLKKKMVEMFRDKFYIDEKGFIREY